MGSLLSLVCPLFHRPGCVFLQYFSPDLLFTEAWFKNVISALPLDGGHESGGPGHVGASSDDVSGGANTNLDVMTIVGINITFVVMIVLSPYFTASFISGQTMGPFAVMAASFLSSRVLTVMKTAGVLPPAAGSRVAPFPTNGGARNDSGRFKPLRRRFGDNISFGPPSPTLGRRTEMISFFERKLSKREVEERESISRSGERPLTGAFLRRLCLVLALTNMLLLILLKSSFHKPPLIIRVDEVGKAEPIHNVNALSRLTKPEVLAYVRLFMRTYLERNWFTWRQNFEEAGAMMTDEFRLKASADLEKRSGGLGGGNEQAHLQTHALLHRSEPRNKRGDLCVPGGWREITSYRDPKFLNETIFEGELVLKKVPHTMETPYGLLVAAYKQNVLKNQ